MTAARPLRVPTEAQIRRAFNSYPSPPKELSRFMTAIYPVVDDVFITYTIATAVAQIASMGPARKIKHLDILLGEVNFPPSVAREINRTIDLVVVPPGYTRAAERLLPPLENLAGALTEPDAALPRQTYREVMQSFETIRADFVKYVSNGFVGFTVAHESWRERFLRSAVEKIPERIRNIDKIAAICDSVLQAPATWQEPAVTPMRLVAILNASKARDDEAQQLVDDGATLSAARAFLTIIDELIIDHCERDMKAGPPPSQTAAFWQQVLDIVGRNSSELRGSGQLPAGGEGADAPGPPGAED